MKKIDWWLFAIVAGIIGLILIAFVIVLQRPEPTYLEDNSPEGVAHNYLLALQRGDYERAYGYVSPTVKYPQDQKEFETNIADRYWEFDMQDTSLSIEQSTEVSDTSAYVIVRRSEFSNDGPFGGGENSRNFRLRLEKIDDRWLIWDGDAFWSECWGRTNSCEPPTRLPAVPNPDQSRS